jgi:glycosyltransferase involved in cell wall biosynthesis
MNVLELCLSSGLGGLELYVFRSSIALSESQQRDNNVIAVLLEDSKLDDYYRNNSNISIHYLKRFFHPLPLVNAYRLARLIDTENIDVIHMHWGKDLPLAALGKYLSRRKPALIYTRQMMITREKNDFYHNFLYSQMDLLLTITRELESLCKKFISNSADRIRTLYYGVKQPERFLEEDEITEQRAEIGFAEDDFVVGLIGRLEESKGQHLLIEAVSTAKRNGQQIKALIVGHEMTAGYRDKLKSQAESSGVQENIVYQDFVTQPQMLMQLCDCVVLASGQETFGLVLPEAMRSGVAVIGSNSGGVPEIIDHEKTGLLFDTQDAASLYQQIEKLYLDREFMNTLARNGKTKADEVFNNDTHFQTLEDIFITTKSS